MLTATPNSIRQVNRAILLNLIRRYQPITRAELARRTGLFRSSVSDIVEQLLAEQLLVESTPANSPRATQVLGLNDAAQRVLGWVLRQDVSDLAVAGLSGVIQHSISFDTPHNPEELAPRLRKAIDFLEFQVDAKVHRGYTRLAIAVFGQVHPLHGRLGRVSHRPSWKDFDLTAAVRKCLPTYAAPVYVRTDAVANALSLAHAWRVGPDGPAADALLVYLDHYDVLTGICRAGTVYRCTNTQIAPDLAHFPYLPDPVSCACGLAGCWSGTICAELRRNAGTGEALAALGGHLGSGLRSMCGLFDPCNVIVGGELAGAWQILQRILADYFPPHRSSVTLSPVLQDRDTLMQGAIFLALEELYRIPSFG